MNHITCASDPQTGMMCMPVWKEMVHHSQTDLYDVHASVERDGGHGACVVVRHLHGPVPLAAVTIQQHPQAGLGQLVESGDLLHVHCELEGDIAQQGGGDVAGCTHPGPQPVQS